MASNNLPIYHIAFSHSDVRKFVSFYEMLEMVRNRELTKETYVWKSGMEYWSKASTISELNPLFEEPPYVNKLFPEDILPP